MHVSKKFSSLMDILLHVLFVSIARYDQVYLRRTFYVHETPFSIADIVIEPRCGKTGFLHMRKQRCRFSLHSWYNPSTFQIRNFKPLAIFCGCTYLFVSDLVGNPEDLFSHNEARIKNPSLGLDV